MTVRKASPACTQILLYGLLECMRVYFHLPYRQTERVVKVHVRKKVIIISDYFTINRHVTKPT